MPIVTLAIALGLYGAPASGPATGPQCRAAPKGTSGAARKPPSSPKCAPEGTRCTFSRDCCSRNCVNDPRLGQVCKPKGASWTCVPRGRRCTFSSDCCSRNCVHDRRLGKVCKRRGATWKCRPAGDDCTFSSDCCSKRCVSLRGRKLCR